MRKSQTRQAIKDVENRVCTHLLWGVFTAGILSLAGPAALAQDCDTDQDPVEYDSSNANGYTPDETPDWSLKCPGQDGDTNLDAIIDGVLVVDDNSVTTKAKYCAEDLFIDRCDPRQDAVYEFSCRAVSVDLNANAWADSEADFVFACGMSTGDSGSFDHDFRVAVTLDKGVGFWTEDAEGNATWLEVGGDQQRVNIDQDPGTDEWDDFHLFRIEKHSDPAVNEVRLFLDNEATPSLAFDLDLLPNNFLDDLTILAETSQNGKSKFELLHFRYRIGTTVFDKPPPDCAADFDNDGTVGLPDLLQLLGAWGPCTACVEDLDGDDTVGVKDLLILLGSWGPCP